VSSASPTPPRRAAWRLVSLAWGVACVAVIGGLIAELALVLQRRAAAAVVREHASANVFEQGRGVMEADGESLWATPGVSYRPGARLALTVAGERYEIRINAEGFRGPDFSAAKPPGTLRVACIGSSTTVQGRTDGETYPALLEKKLRRRHPGRRIEVLNLGINGTLSDYWLWKRRRLFGYEPDVVVQYNFVNDLFFRDLERYAGDHPWRGRLNRSLLLSRALPLDPSDFDPYFRRTLRSFQKMAQVAAARGAAYVVGSFAGPDPGRASPSFLAYLDANAESWGTALGIRYYRDYDRLRRRYDGRFRAFAEKKGLAAAMVDDRLSDPSLFVDLCHMTPAGIDLLAEAFVPAVETALDRSLAR
jgi:hypothetical protein